MFKRLANAIRAFFGSLVRGFENPETMLQQYMDDLRGKVPKLNSTVAEVMKTEILLRGQIEKMERKLAELDQQVVAAVKLGPQYDEEAKMLISALETTKTDLEETRRQHEAAVKASEQAKLAREDFLRTMNQRIQDAMRAIDKNKQAKMQEQLAGLMMSFTPGDESDTLERMTQKVDERAARAEAQVGLATSGVDARLRDIKRATAEVGAESKLLEYKRQLGMLPPEPEQPEVAKTMEPATSAVDPPQQKKVEPPQTR